MASLKESLKIVLKMLITQKYYFYSVSFMVKVSQEYILTAKFKSIFFMCFT